jgi:hypothetical protein
MIIKNRILTRSWGLRKGQSRENRKKSQNEKLLDLVVLATSYKCDQKEDEMGRSCGMNRGRQIFKQRRDANFMEKDHCKALWRKWMATLKVDQAQ